MAGYAWALHHPDIDYVAFSILNIPLAYNVEKDNKLQRFLARWRFMHLLESRGLLPALQSKKVHFLGLLDGPNEIELVKDYHQYITTWDSSSAVWAGINGIEYDNSPTGLTNGKFELEVDFKHNHADNDIVRLSNTKAKRNMVTIDRMLMKDDDNTSVEKIYSDRYLADVVNNDLFNDSGAGDLKSDDNSEVYRYGEGNMLDEVKSYIASTYAGHYVGNGDLQTTDVWNTLGSADTTSRDTAIKYLMRYGKKGGNNKKDLMKAIHYICLLHHFTEVNNND